MEYFSTRMYTSLRGVIDGWTKNVYAGGKYAMPAGTPRWFFLALMFGPPLIFLAPVVIALRQGDLHRRPDSAVDVTAEEGRVLRALAYSHRSLFEVVDTFPRELLLSDLIADGLWRIDQDGCPSPESPSAPGSTK